MTAIDHSRAGKRAKRRGERGELEIRDLLREAGYTNSHRNFQSGGQGGGDLADAISDVHLEVKYCETVRLSSWWRQANQGARPTDSVWIVHRGNGQPWQATLLLTDLLGLTVGPIAPRCVSIHVRAEFIADHKDTTSTCRPMIVHQQGSACLATVLFEDLLGWWPQ